MATFAGLFPARDIWVLQEFTQCHLATEETLADRVSFGAMERPHDRAWGVDGGIMRMQWYKSGQMMWRKNYKNGKQHGLSEGWHRSGQRDWSVNYKCGKRHGLWQGWDASGHPQWREIWKDGNHIWRK